MAESDWVRFRDPKIGTTSRQIAERCGWQVRGNSDDLRVCANERYSEAAPALLRLRPLIDNRGEHSGAIQDVARWGHADLYARLDPSLVDQEIARLTQVNSREGGWAAHMLRCHSCPPAEMPAYLRSANAQLRTSDLFPDIGLWSVSESELASYRHHIVRSLILAEHHPDAVELVKQGTLGIDMAAGMRSQSMGTPRGERIAPLLVSSAPWLIGFAADRVGGTILFMLGKFEYGRSSQLPHTDLIDQLQSTVFGREDPGGRQQPDYSSADALAALEWWVEGLNRLTAVEHDPATHRTKDGWYDPVRHLAMSLTIDRLVAIVQQVTIADRRNSMLRKLLLFDALDLLEGLLTQHKFGTLTTLSQARKQLKELEDALPGPVKRVLLPRCRDAVDALADVQQGFWVPGSRTTTGVKIPSSARPDQVVPYDTASSRALRLVRNGHHGFLDEKFQSDPAKRALLILHDGRLPDALPDLAFFHLVRLLAFADLLDPERLYERRQA